MRWKCLGSGDPPGLQNRRSSLTGDGVFDSHALPPDTCALAIHNVKQLTASLLQSKRNPVERIGKKLEDWKALGVSRIAFVHSSKIYASLLGANAWPRSHRLCAFGIGWFRWDST